MRGPRRPDGRPGVAAAADAPAEAAEAVAAAGPHATPDEPSVPVHVTVLHADGKPAAGATVRLLDTEIDIALTATPK